MKGTIWACPRKYEREFPVYAIVRAGGRQEKVSVGDVLIAVGTASELKALEEMFEPRKAVAG